MVIVFSQTLEKKKAANDVTSKSIERRLVRETLRFDFNTRWLDMGRSCAIQQRAPCQSGTPLWDVTPDHNSHCAKEPGSTTAITSLIRDLSLCNSTHAASTTCRSLSLSEEFTGFRSSWRPQGSRVWTTVEKRRCHSGGSVRGGGSHFPTMQRSSSFSLPSHSSITFDGIQDLPFFNQPLPLHPQFTASPVSPTSLATHHHHSQNHVFLRPLSLSHEQISLPEHQREEASETSSSDSTPELGRRASQRARGKGCLSRSRSQPCVLNEKKVGMKRRRPEDAQEQRPSLDLTKMTQTLQSLSCPGFSSSDNCQSVLSPPTLDLIDQPDSDFTGVSELGLESWQEVIGDDEEADSSYEDSDSACSVDSRPGSPVGIEDGKRTLWKGDCGTQRDIFQLGGELDLEQIERN
uniref:Protein FAM53B-like n=1 Tax=Pundamilia nyererei TaxID=303518 RepID=A0A3B4F3D1_9CICH